MRDVRISGILAALLTLGSVLSGCATPTSRSDLWREHFGIRPDEPAIQLRSAKDGVERIVDSCEQYKTYSDYAQQLQEAYHSRATQNRAWIYVAGVLGLGAAAASGALAATTAVAAGTLALLAISGGFSAATFATIDNSDLAALYTVSANSIDAALKTANNLLPEGGPYTGAACGEALRKLREGVSEARTTLEVGRTNTAAGALVRAQAQLKSLKELLQSYEKKPPTGLTANPSTLTIDPTKDASVPLALQGGKAGYGPTPASLKGITVAPVSGKNDIFTVTISKDAAEGNLVFVDSTSPEPLSVTVPVKKKPQ
jgi:hypothetical protein